MGSSMPFFSILVSVFNRIIFIDSLINCINSQTLKDYEVIIVDNGSTDGSFEYLSELNLPNFHTFQILERGTSFTRNFGVSKSSGEYILILDTDNRFISNDTLYHLKNIIIENRRFPVFLFPNNDYFNKKISFSPIYDNNINLHTYLRMKGEFTLIANKNWYSSNHHHEVKNVLHSFSTLLLIPIAIESNIFVSSYVSQLYNTSIYSRVSNGELDKLKAFGLYEHYKKIASEYGHIILKTSPFYFIKFKLKKIYYFLIINIYNIIENPSNIFQKNIYRLILKFMLQLK